MTTPNWGLPRFDDNDPACGSDQMGQLAGAADTALAAARGRPRYPWAYVLLQLATVGAGATFTPGPALVLEQSAHNIFSAAGGQISTSVAGVYRASLNVRWQATPTNAPAASAVFTTYLDVPPGTVIGDWAARAYNAGRSGTNPCGVLINWPTGSPLVMRYVNGSSVSANAGGELWLERIGRLMGAPGGPY